MRTRDHPLGLGSAGIPRSDRFHLHFARCAGAAVYDVPCVTQICLPPSSGRFADRLRVPL